MHLISPADEQRDALHAAHDDALKLLDQTGIVGYGIAVLFDGDGKCVQLAPFRNLVTDAGDLYYASKAIVGISPANASAPTAANGMKLGTGNTAASKTDAGLATYLSGSNAAFDSSYPQTSNLGSGLGVTAVYKTTWAAGTATSSTINEVAIVNDRATDADSSAANTYARAVLTTVNKTSSDTLAITWAHKLLGS